MHVSHEFLRTLAIVLGVAAVTTMVFQRLRLPVVFGYMMAGLIVGPHVPIPLVADEGIVRTLSELGVILLMFSLGLEFTLRRLASAGWSVVIVAVLETGFMMWLGFEAGRLMGWPVLASLFAGATIAISSTTIIVKALAGPRGRDHSRATDLVFGILIVEDLIAILLLAVLTPAAASGTANAGTLVESCTRPTANAARARTSASGCESARASSPPAQSRRSSARTTARSTASRGWATARSACVTAKARSNANTRDGRDGTCDGITRTSGGDGRARCVNASGGRPGRFRGRAVPRRGADDAASPDARSP